MSDACPYVTPRALLRGRSALDAVLQGQAWPLAAGYGPLAFAVVEISYLNNQSIKTALVPRSQYESPQCGIENGVRIHVDARLTEFARSRHLFASTELTYPLIMGIVNVTPDSFSDGGRFHDANAAIAHGLSLRDAGASIVDVGGESTRPGAAPVAPEEEIARIAPVVRGLVSQGVCVSIDTRRSAVMAAAFEAGARIVNDVTALAGDSKSLRLVTNADVAVILMHMQGEPRTMQNNPAYAWAPGDVYDFLRARIEACLNAGMAPEQIAIDPGIGFGKNVAHNATVMDHFGLFHGLGHPLVFGASRKSFIAQMSLGESPDKRLAGSLAAALHAVAQGAHILRVHDVTETRQALAVAAEVAGTPRGGAGAIQEDVVN
jgi:dihydropteroate synthase